mmetsp:Transcript_16562/g.28716  ORF Transcript_16562/g.28716 Transcript_16562/m.28716 type:complete len:208 (-) Transcript_16562:742-1365(-)
MSRADPLRAFSTSRMRRLMSDSVRCNFETWFCRRLSAIFASRTCRRRSVSSGAEKVSSRGAERLREEPAASLRTASVTRWRSSTKHSYTGLLLGTNTTSAARERVMSMVERRARSMRLAMEAVSRRMSALTVSRDFFSSDAAVLSLEASASLEVIQERYRLTSRSNASSFFLPSSAIASASLFVESSRSSVVICRFMSAFSLARRLL